MQLRTPLNILIILLLLIPVAGCAPELTYDGRNTIIGNIEKIKSCRLLGNTSISLPQTTAKMLNKEEISMRLQIEARNFGGRIGADTVIPVDEIKEGKQLFQLFFCDRRKLKDMSSN